MRIAVVHSFYSSAQPSGENRVVEDQVEVLKQAGHQVELVRQDTEALQGGLYAAKTAINLVSGSGFDPSDALSRFNPDVVHVHNLFPNFSTGWIAKISAPTVVSLHNYRTVCSNGLLYRDGNICHECPDRGNQRSVVHGCYRDSRVATIPVALSRGRNQRDLLTGAAAIVTTSALSDQVIKRFVPIELSTHIIPNFIDQVDSLLSTPTSPRNWIAMGRFTPEKGFVELVRDWPDSEALIVVGDGELEGEIKVAAAGKRIEFLSSLPREQLREIISQSFGMIFPSRWYESDPQVVAEAMRVGVPVVAFHVNTTAELVSATGSGVVYQDRASLKAALGSVVENRDAMSVAARGEFQRRWTKAAWLSKIEALYGYVVKQND
jgi:glycosyltransferase involved in cell wall biosynthesis